MIDIIGDTVLTYYYILGKSVCVFSHDIEQTKVLNTLPTVFNPKRCGLLGGVFFGEIKFVVSNFLSNEDLSISYES